MNMIGRHTSRSNQTSHHRRQHSDNFLDNGKWLQSYSQDFGFRLNRSMQSSGQPKPPLYSRSSSLRKTGDVDVSALGLLDIHSFDSELLLPEVLVPSRYEAYNKPTHGGSFLDSELNFGANKLTNRSRGLADNNLLKSFSPDKERANSVAKIKVVVRKRPLNKREIAKKEADIVTIEPNSNYLTVHETRLKVDLAEYVEKHEFIFDAVLNEDASNDAVYSETVEPIVPLIFQRTKATCFAYGQTGSGKTYTMQPLPLKASQDILRLMYQAYRNQGFQLFVSFFEIYGGKLYDLLNDRKKLCMREDGKQHVCIVGLQEYRVTDVKAIGELIEKGNATRSTGTTGANEESSRSHAILQLAVKKSADGSESKAPRIVGKLSFIDLAGSERGADTTDNDKQTRMEGAEINKSLLALKECIRALDNDQCHIPFRGSKLTEVLRDSFVGDSRTVMISCISPSSGSCEHTLNTLRYADRVKSLSKGNSTKRDPLSSLKLRNSVAMPLTSALSVESEFDENVMEVSKVKNKFGWPKQNGREKHPTCNLYCVQRGRAVYFSESESVYLDHFDGQRDGETGMSDVDSLSVDDAFEEEKSSPMNNEKAEAYRISTMEAKQQKDSIIRCKDSLAFQANSFPSDDDLDSLLKEEDDLVSAHCRQVEKTIDMVREEMNLLVKADQPGNQLQEYVSKLSAILSQKAAGILQLQARLVQFQRHLSENHVIVFLPGN